MSKVTETATNDLPTGAAAEAENPKRQDKPAEAKPAEAKPVEAKPVEAKSANPVEFLRGLAQDSLAGPLSPLVLGPAFADLAEHLAVAPRYDLEMAQAAARQALRGIASDQWPAPIGGDKAADHRFVDPAWRQPPFCYIAQNFLLGEQWLNACILNAPGVSKQHARLAAFAGRQMLDAFSPSNLPWANPEVWRATRSQYGMNFLRGAEHFFEDAHRQIDPRSANAAKDFVVGRDVAATPGKVVWRNELMELIQYAPTTALTRPEPLLIVPAWIMKYYILDLSPHNSLIRYLVGCGYTVFCISWRNPGPEMRETSLDDYRRLGPMAALDIIGEICGKQKVHALGYCLGGTLLAIAAAAMARDGDERLASVALLAAQTDFTEPGELQLFIDETQLDVLDKIMARQGYLDSRQMAGAFSMLRSNDLVWSRMVKSYLLGESEHGNDLMAWNADATRMPYRMHSEYLHHMFLHNDLAEGRFCVGDRPVDLAAIQAPILAVGTEADHVAPWRSVFKIEKLNSGDITFLLASGGHNGGIVSEPGHKHRSYLAGHRPQGGPALSPSDFMATAAHCQGSWWPAYAGWLDGLSGTLGVAPPMGAPGRPVLGDAPGAYVHEA